MRTATSCVLGPFVLVLLAGAASAAGTTSDDVIAREIPVCDDPTLDESMGVRNVRLPSELALRAEATPQVRYPQTQAARQGDVNILFGYRQMNDADWGQLDGQTNLGLLVSWDRPSMPLGFEAGLQESWAITTISNGPA